MKHALEYGVNTHKYLYKFPNGGIISSHPAPVPGLPKLAFILQCGEDMTGNVVGKCEEDVVKQRDKRRVKV